MSSHGFIMVPRRAALLVCPTCEPVVRGLMQDGAGVPPESLISFPARVPPGDIAECSLCGEPIGDTADTIGPPANILPC
jgi:hypothetical protein